MTVEGCYDSVDKGEWGLGTERSLLGTRRRYEGRRNDQSRSKKSSQ